MKSKHWTIDGMWALIEENLSDVDLICLLIECLVRKRSIYDRYALELKRYKQGKNDDPIIWILQGDYWDVVRLQSRTLAELAGRDYAITDLYLDLTDQIYEGELEVMI